MAKLVEMAASIIEAQAMSKAMETEELEDSLRRIFSALQELSAIEAGEQVESSDTGQSTATGTEQLSPLESIQDDYVICLECGKQFNQLTANHLKSHGLTPREYKKKWGFRLKDSLACKNLQKSRSDAAKKRGIPEKLKEYHERRRKKAAQK